MSVGLSPCGSATAFVSSSRIDRYVPACSTISKLAPGMSAYSSGSSSPIPIQRVRPMRSEPDASAADQDFPAFSAPATRVMGQGASPVGLRVLRLMLRPSAR